MSPTDGLIRAVAGSISGMAQRAQGLTGCKRNSSWAPPSTRSMSIRSSSCAAMPASTRFGRKRSMPTAAWAAAPPPPPNFPPPTPPPHPPHQHTTNKFPPRGLAEQQQRETIAELVRGLPAVRPLHARQTPVLGVEPDQPTRLAQK